MRNLEREVAGICRKVAMKFAMGNRKRVVLSRSNLYRYLGARRILPGERLTRNQIGVATGLAWTPVGGEILYVEAQAIYALVRGPGTLDKPDPHAFAGALLVAEFLRTARNLVEGLSRGRK